MRKTLYTYHLNSNVRWITIASASLFCFSVPATARKLTHLPPLYPNSNVKVPKVPPLPITTNTPKGFTLKPLPSIPAPTPRPVAPPAVSTPKEPERILFDEFESGTYSNWTLSGDCWGDQPTYWTVFGGKIVGYKGDRYLCSLDPKRGTRATGVAVSREFTINKPIISFLVGGGSHPGETCMNLVIARRVVATITGNDLPTFVEQQWNISSYLGSTAHLEVIDNSESPDRGYIMIDDIEFRDAN